MMDEAVDFLEGIHLCAFFCGFSLGELLRKICHIHNALQMQMPRAVSFLDSGGWHILIHPPEN